MRSVLKPYHSYIDRPSFDVKRLVSMLMLGSVGPAQHFVASVSDFLLRLLPDLIQLQTVDDEIV